MDKTFITSEKTISPQNYMLLGGRGTIEFNADTTDVSKVVLVLVNTTDNGLLEENITLSNDDALTIKNILMTTLGAQSADGVVQ